MNALLFLGYWELDENIGPKKAAELFAEALQKGVWPAKGIKVVSHYVSVDVPVWGVLTYEADNPEQIMKNIAVLRLTKPSFFKKVIVSPAMKAEEAVSVLMEM